MNRVLFVGMNNKPGFSPLDSKSKSGKLIDRVINELNAYSVLKTNLYDQERYPRNPVTSDIYDWARRVEYNGDDIVIALGVCVQDVFTNGTIRFIKLGHPSAVWAHKKQKEYIKRALRLINDL